MLRGDRLRANIQSQKMTGDLRPPMDIFRIRSRASAYVNRALR